MKSVRHSIGQVSFLVAAVLSSLTAISHANPSLESSSFFRNGKTDQTNAFDSPNPSVRWGNRLNAPPPTHTRQRPTPNGITIKAGRTGIEVRGDSNQLVSVDARTVTVRPDGENAFGQISEIRQVCEIGELNNELFIEVADNKDLTLSVDEP